MRILQIEDDPCIAECVAMMLEELPHVELVTAELGEDGIKLANDNFDVIMLDLGLPDMPGNHVLQSIRAKGVATPIVVVSGSGDGIAGVRFLQKPYSTSDYLACIQAAALEGKLERGRRESIPKAA